MPKTRSALSEWHDAAFATSTATLASFPGTISGSYPGEPEIKPGESLANGFDCPSIAITTNHLLSERYGYDDGFDHFTSPHTTQTVKDDVAGSLTVGSPAYRLASTAWGVIQSIRERLGGLEKSFRPADAVIEEFLTTVDIDEEWFGWLHFMEPHYPYDPDGAPMGRADAQTMTRKALAGDATPEEEQQVRNLYRMEVEELDQKLAVLWDAIPQDTRIVFCADHGELLGEDGLWGHPGEARPGLLNVPFGTRNLPETGDVVSLIDVPTLLTGEVWGEGTLNRETAFASYGETKIAANESHMTSEAGTMTLDGEPASNPTLEHRLDRFDPEHVVKEDAVREDLEELGYV